jgi:hypothetical protein
MQLPLQPPPVQQQQQEQQQQQVQLPRCPLPALLVEATPYGLQVGYLSPSAYYSKLRRQQFLLLQQHQQQQQQQEMPTLSQQQLQAYVAAAWPLTVTATISCGTLLPASCCSSHTTQHH